MAPKLPNGVMSDLLRDANETTLLEVNFFMEHYPIFIAAIMAGNYDTAKWSVDHALAQGWINQATRDYIYNHIGES